MRATEYIAERFDEMAAIFLLVLPIFLVIALGKLLEKTLVKDPVVWAGINKIAYWTLFPCFLFHETSTIDLKSGNVFGYSSALVVGFVVATFAAYLIGMILRLEYRAISSILQGAGRHNTFIGLAVAGQIFGSMGTKIGTIATAALVPLSNVVMVTSLAALRTHDGTGGAGAARIIKDVGSNPIVLSITVGLVVNYLGWEKDPLVYEFSGVVGKATLPVLLLCIGANLKFQGLGAQIVPSFVAILAKMVVFPLVAIAVAMGLELSREVTTIAVIFSACPTSPASFPLAKQMGGDASLMATIISIQTALSVLTIPLSVSLLSGLM